MGLAACPRASFAVGGIGAGVEGSFADLTANVPGTVREGIIGNAIGWNRMDTA